MEYHTTATWGSILCAKLWGLFMALSNGTTQVNSTQFSDCTFPVQTQVHELKLLLFCKCAAFVLNAVSTCITKGKWSHPVHTNKLSFNTWVLFEGPQSGFVAVKKLINPGWFSDKWKAPRTGDQKWQVTLTHHLSLRYFSPSCSIFITLISLPGISLVEVPFFWCLNSFWMADDKQSTTLTKG